MRITMGFKLSECPTFTDLADRVAALEAQPDSDDQQIQSLAVVGPDLVVTLEDGGSASVPLADIQDGTGTDDQQLTQFEVTGGNLVIALEDGGSLSVPMTAFDFDTDVSAFDLNWNPATGQLTGFVTEDGATVSDTIGIALDVELTQKLVPVGFANVNANGSIAASYGGPVIQRLSVGRYQATTLPAGALTAQVTVVEAYATRDSVTPRLEDFASTWHITEGDNGGPANTPRDRPHTVVWYGLEDRVTDVDWLP